MPLADLTDNPPDDGSDGQPKRLHMYMDAPEAKKDDPVVEDGSKPSDSIIGAALDRIVGRLTGTNGYERYQTWPEKMVREAVSTPHDAMTGQLPMNAVDPLTGEVHTSSQAIEGAQAIAGMAGTGGLSSMTDATLGSTPFLRPALKYGDKIYKAPVNGQHLDAIPPDIYPEFQRQAMSGEDISNFNFGFMNHKGQFLDRQKALDYAVENGLVDKDAGKYGALTSTLMSDSGTPGMAIEAAAKANPFFSAVEHAVNNNSQPKMTGSQWLGTLSNKPGVKPEEMQWTGLNDFLKENGNTPVTREQVQEHLANNKVSLSEVNKGTGELHKAAKDFNIEAGPKAIDVKGRGQLYADEIEQGLWDGSLTPKDLPTNLQPHAEKMLSLRHQQESPTKYHSYQLPGGDNYREMLMTLPNKQQRTYEFEYFDPKTQTSKQFKTEAEAKAAAPAGAVVLPKEVSSINEPYRSSHWDEPNILAHVRMNDRTIDGKKSLHLEEIQSDWHQQGRDKGYKGDWPKFTKEHNAELETLRAKLKVDKEKMSTDDLIKSDDWKRFNDLQNQRNTAENPPGVPDAPFKKTWHELALKRMIREAAAKGYDRLSWTPGEAQAARYDLSKSVDKIQWSPDTETLMAYDKSGNKVINQSKATADKLPDIIGKEAAKKLLETEGQHLNSRSPVKYHILEGADLKVGGEGMKGFYDKMIPKAVEKISGQKVQQSNIPSDRYNVVPGYRGKTWDVVTQDGTGVKKFDTKPEAEAYVKERGPKVHFIDIPQSLRDTAMHKGFPLFSGGLMFSPVDGDPTK